MSKLVTKEILDIIFKELMAGKSMKSICRNNEGFPHRQTVMSHIQKDQEVFERYQAARAIQGEIIADEMKDLLDAAPPNRVRSDNRACRKLCRAWVSKRSPHSKAANVSRSCGWSGASAK